MLCLDLTNEPTQLCAASSSIFLRRHAHNDYARSCLLPAKPMNTMRLRLILVWEADPGGVRYLTKVFFLFCLFAYVIGFVGVGVWVAGWLGDWVAG